VDSATATSQNGFCSQKLYEKINYTQNVTKTLQFLLFSPVS
jgi:hypothetical protein